MTDEYGPSNRGRWGTDDQRGTLSSSRRPSFWMLSHMFGRVRSSPLAARSAPTPPSSRPACDSAHGSAVDGRPTGYADDALVINSHSSTHLDTLSHQSLDGHMYNGSAVADVVSSFGAVRKSVDNVGATVTRGILLRAR